MCLCVYINNVTTPKNNDDGENDRNINGARLTAAYNDDLLASPKNMTQSGESSSSFAASQLRADDA